MVLNLWPVGLYHVAHGGPHRSGYLVVGDQWKGQVFQLNITTPLLPNLRTPGEPCRSDDMTMTTCTTSDMAGCSAYGQAMASMLDHTCRLIPCASSMLNQASRLTLPMGSGPISFFQPAGLEADHHCLGGKELLTDTGNQIALNINWCLDSISTYFILVFYCFCKSGWLSSKRGGGLGIGRGCWGSTCVYTLGRSRHSCNLFSLSLRDGDVRLWDSKILLPLLSLAECCSGINYENLTAAFKNLYCACPCALDNFLTNSFSAALLSYCPRIIVFIII